MAIKTAPAPDKIFTMPDKRPVTTGRIGGSVTLKVVQGIGDIFWTYQKFSPYFDRINFTIMLTRDLPIQKRAFDWLKTWEKTGDVTTEVVPSDRYHRGAHGFFRLQDCFDNGFDRPIEYAANAWLEAGVRIEDIDPGAMVDTDVQMKIADRPKYPAGEYLVLYASGSTTSKTIQHDPRYGVWTCEQWAGFANKFLDRVGKNLPVVVIGQFYDEEAIRSLTDLMMQNKRTVSALIGYPPAQVASLLKHSSYFIGYQSGLGIIADALGARQVMLYFNQHRPMLNTWCRREHIGGKFQAACFEDSPDEIIERAVEA